MAPHVEPRLDRALFATLEHVWKVMLRRELVPVEDPKAESPLAADGVPMLTAWSGLSGGFTGSVHLHCDRAAAESFSSWLLNDSQEPLRDHDLADCLAELCNVVTGNLKAALAPSTELGLPGVVIGEDYHLRLPGGRAVARVCCECEGRRFEALVVRRDDG